MSKVRLPECGVAIGALSLLCLLLMADRSEGGPAASRLFNGTTLAGWHVLGAGGWRVANGAMVGSAKNHETNWLVLDRSYEDFIVGLEFQCTACEAGILVRNAPVKAAGNRTSGVYVPRSGADSRKVYRVSLDSEGKNSIGSSWRLSRNGLPS